MWWPFWVNTRAHHRQQLFHWIGSHIEEERASRDLTDAQRQKYVECLDDTLARGLWVKVPRVPDPLYGHEVATREMVCFTEWSLRESGRHTGVYGRLGLGFTKRFVLAKGGHPVLYSNGRSRLIQSFSKLANRIDPRAAEELEYAAHFIKRVAPPEPRTKPRTSTRTRKIATAKAGVREPFGTKPLPWLEEREWRIVRRPSSDPCLVPNSSGEAIPPYRLPFSVGQELLTIVVPDAETMTLALDHHGIRSHLRDHSGNPIVMLPLEFATTI